MIRSIPLFVLIFCSFFCRAQYPGFSMPDHPEVFKKSFALATANIESIHSDFRQEKSLSMLSEKIISTGKFWYRKNDKLQMEYLQPFNYLMILNAGKIFTRDGQKESSVSAGSNRVFQQVNRILIDCVAGTMLDNPDFQSRVFESNGAYLVELKPLSKNLAALYKNINIVVDKKDFTATVIEMYEISGDKTIIRFQNKSINVQIPDSVFNIP